MTLHFIQLKLGNKTYKDQVTTEACFYVDDFRSAIKSKFSPQLDSYASHHLTVFKPDGNTEIDPAESITKLDEFNVGPWTPLVVTVEELPIPGQINSTKKQLTYKGMSTEVSCIKFLNAVAIEIYFEYDFPTSCKTPTMGDVLAAKDSKQGRPSQLCDDTGRPFLWWDYKTIDGIQLTTTPLPSLLSARQWDVLESLQGDIIKRIHDSKLPQTSSHKSFVVLPHSKYETKEYVNNLKSIAAKAKIVEEEDDLIVKDMSDLSGSSESESEYPNKDKKMK